MKEEERFRRGTGKERKIVGGVDILTGMRAEKGRKKIAGRAQEPPRLKTKGEQRIKSIVDKAAGQDAGAHLVSPGEWAFIMMPPGLTIGFILSLLLVATMLPGQRR